METLAAFVASSASLSPHPNRFVVRVRRRGRRRFELVATVTAAGEALATIVDQIQLAIDGIDGTIEQVFVEAWQAGAKRHCALHEISGDQIEVGDEDAGKDPWQRLCDLQSRYIAQLQSQNVALLQHVPQHATRSLELVENIARHANQERDEWRSTALHLMFGEHHGLTIAAARQPATDPAKALASETVHHAGRSLVSALAARLGGADASGPLGSAVVDSLREFTASIDESQLDQMLKALRPEQAIALTTLLNTAVTGQIAESSDAG